MNGGSKQSTGSRRTGEKDHFAYASVSWNYIYSYFWPDYDYFVTASAKSGKADKELLCVRERKEKSVTFNRYSKLRRGILTSGLYMHVL